MLMEGEVASPMEAVAFAAASSDHPDSLAAAKATRSVRSEYDARLARARISHARSELRERRLATARLVVFLALLVVAGMAFVAKTISPWWVMIPLGVFVFLVRAFDQTSEATRRALRLTSFYELGLARLDDRWMDLGETGERFRDRDHPYAEDLDLFGKGSLFQRVTMARTAIGEEILASWLLAPAPPEIIRERQQAVDELKPRLDLREDVAVLGADLGPSVGFAGLAEWGARARLMDSPWARLLCALLAIVALPALFAWLFFQQSAIPFVVIASIEGVVGFHYFSRVRAVLSQIEKRADELDMLAGILGRLERERFRSRVLIRITRALEVAGKPASTRIARLRALVATLDARRNMLVAPISPLLMWGTQVALAVEAWRGVSGPSIKGWLEAIGEFEALLSLSGFAYENPDDPFPEVADTSDSFFDAEGLGHPLVPAARLVRNDVRLGGSGSPRVLIVSGSNMSGKSTVLRAVGTAAVLAQAGGTVRAMRLRLSPLAVGATLRVQDSLLAGRSRFYAEILRLKRMIEMAGKTPGLLALLDEILAGTNSHDRRVGAEAIVAGLVERHAIGLVTTHDLALAEIAGRLGSRAANVHFADHFEDGVMRFDYRIQPGVVSHSNALALMRSVGLEV
jgi:hypothetical protein